MNKIQKIEEYVKSLPEGKIAHGFDHVNRVRNWAIKIAKKENYSNVELAEAAALLHDIGLKKAIKENKVKLHGQFSSDMAKEFLKNNKLFSEKNIDEICDAISHHNTIDKDISLLSKIVRDADILDLLGTMGIMRAAMSEAQKPMYDIKNIKGETWEMDSKDFDKRFESGVGIGPTIVDQVNFQISCYDNISTSYAKKIALSLVEEMKEFTLKLESEINK
jgi:uncharacterized protein